MTKATLHGSLLGLLCAVCALALAARASAKPQLDSDVAPGRAEANAPVEPFKIIDNIYYVGTFDYGIYLIVTPAGNILLDSGWPDTPPLIEASIKKLGFRVEDIKWLINSHGHPDHTGGFAELKRLSGAKLAISAPDVDLLERGGPPPNGSPAVHVDRVIREGDTLELGGVVLTAHMTPGHEIGCTTWTMVAEEGGKKYNVVFVGGTHPTAQAFKNLAQYPAMPSDFEHTFALLRGLPCDVPLVSHGILFNLTRKRAMLGKGGPNPFIDPAGYKAMLDEEEGLFHKLQAEAAQTPAQPQRN
jgi:metallo-beta-lactamase class B